MELHQEIIGYWFGDLEPSTPAKGRFDLWFGKDPGTDAAISRRFAPHLDRAAAGAFDSWRDRPPTRLALIVLLDQFPRNAHRDTPRAFAYDAKAREVCLHGLAQGHDRALPFFGRLFFYLPLEHAEDPVLQDHSVELFSALRADAPEALQKNAAMVYDYALRHRDIIRRFGRFPHRNQALGRESSAEEIEFLNQPGSSF